MLYDALLTGKRRICATKCGNLSEMKYRPTS